MTALPPAYNHDAADGHYWIYDYAIGLTGQTCNVCRQRIEYEEPIRWRTSNVARSVQHWAVECPNFTYAPGWEIPAFPFPGV